MSHTAFLWFGADVWVTEGVAGPAAAYSLARVTYNFYTLPRPRHGQYGMVAAPGSPAPRQTRKSRPKVLQAVFDK